MELTDRGRGASRHDILFAFALAAPTTAPALPPSDDGGGVLPIRESYIPSSVGTRSVDVPGTIKKTILKHMIRRRSTDLHSNAPRGVGLPSLQADQKVT